MPYKIRGRGAPWRGRASDVRPRRGGEAYPGGREKNKHADKKGDRKKAVVAGIKDGETGIIRAVSVP